MEPSPALIKARATAGAQERARLAREIHDGVAQDLAGLGYRLDDLATAPGLSPDERGKIRDIRIALSESINLLRRSIFDLRNSDIDFLDEVRTLLNEIEQEGLEVSVDFNAVEGQLNETTARHLHAIAIEAISNVVHHANATQLEFTFANSSNAFQMTIKDNGNGRVAAKEFSYGLATMTERAELIGATCLVERPASGGTIIKVQARVS
ncbi:nitrate/nitrite sensor protein NarX [mine drainage metagenome]|uniref:Nitrate/nitrite sensor protein NarX n=1 Tax=mine drainage metagenome TaxID=410659 RepID=A0A1J5Q9V5_9ZZZZ